MTTPSPRPDRAVRELDIDGKVTLFHPKTQTALVLNETASDVWRLLDGRRTMEEIVAILADSYDADVETVRADVGGALDQLLGHRLIDPAPDPA